MMKPLTLQAAAVCALSVGCSTDPEVTSGSCEPTTDLVADVTSETTSSGVRVYGEANVPDGVAVRAVFVSGQAATKSHFNFRGWQAEISADQLRALATDGVALLSVVAYTSAGCKEVPEAERPRVNVNVADAGTSTQ